MKFISVVIPLYNKEISISNTINSVLSQSHREFELIVVNDGSTDDSLKVVESFQDYRIKLINKENGGVSSARNKGIYESKSEFIAFLDADDLWEKEFLEDMCLLIEKFPDASLYGSSYVTIGRRQEISETYSAFPPEYMGYITNFFEIVLKNYPFHSSCSIYKKSALNQTGLFDETISYGEDVDLWIRFALLKKIAFYNKALSKYRQNAENKATNKIDDRSKYLIWHLHKYAEFEKGNKFLKVFLDNYRLSGVRNYLLGNRNEVNEIDSLLNAIDLKRLPYFWTIIKYMPDNLRSLMYKFRLIVFKSYRKSIPVNKFPTR